METKMTANVHYHVACYFSKNVDSFYLSFSHHPVYTYSTCSYTNLLFHPLTLCFYISTILLLFVKPFVTLNVGIGNSFND